MTSIMDWSAVEEPRFHVPSTASTRGRGTYGDAAVTSHTPWITHGTPRRIVHQVAEKDDRIIRLRMDGLSYSQIARECKLSTPTLAMERYRAARARQIPAEHLPRPIPRPPDLVVAWAAGFFDGEGCVFGYEDIQRDYRRFTFGISVAQIKREPLDELVAGWGGTVRAKASTNPKHQDQFIWQVRGRTAGTFLTDVVPYLRVKRAHAEAARGCLFRTHGKGVPYSDVEIAERRQAVVVLGRLNSPKGGKGRFGGLGRHKQAKEVAE